MRHVVSAVALLACTAASPPADTSGNESFAEPAIRQLQAPAAPSEVICRDRIHTVRSERGLPSLGRDSADPEEPLFIAAVDHRIDGCSVLVMRNDTGDVRPIPKPDENAPLLRPAQ